MAWSTSPGAQAARLRSLARGPRALLQGDFKTSYLGQLMGYLTILDES